MGGMTAPVVGSAIKSMKNKKVEYMKY